MACRGEAVGASGKGQRPDRGLVALEGGDLLGALPDTGGTGERAEYRVAFQGPIGGLRTGATVSFNGIRVGEVTALSLDPNSPRQALATIDELPDIGASWLRTRVNGELRQEAPISDLIFDVPALVATLSEVMTLEPGDVIATGTGQGVGIGFDPPVYLAPGDVVEITIDGIGTLSNPVV